VKDPSRESTEVTPMKILLCIAISSMMYRFPGSNVKHSTTTNNGSIGLDKVETKRGSDVIPPRLDLTMLICKTLYWHFRRQSPFIYTRLIGPFLCYYCSMVETTSSNSEMKNKKF
jgi:hypothetical protein